jgi:hypothetical protein
MLCANFNSHCLFLCKHYNRTPKHHKGICTVLVIFCPSAYDIDTYYFPDKYWFSRFIFSAMEALRTKNKNAKRRKHGIRVINRLAELLKIGKQKGVQENEN